MSLYANIVQQLEFLGRHHMLHSRQAKSKAKFDPP